MATTGNTAPITSGGRGGAGNIGPATTEYTDGGIVREGVAGESVDGEYSAGRGGAGNMVPAAGGRGSTDIVPDVNAVKPQEEFHTGRGGAANVHKEKYGGHTSDPNKPSLLTKIKGILSGKKPPKKETTAPATTTT